jgi:hypothetical protein
MNPSREGCGPVARPPAVLFLVWLLAELAIPLGLGHAQPVALGGEFQVNSYTTSLQAFPAIDFGSAGDFIITWSSNGQDGDDDGIFGRHFDSGGGPIGAEFQVNTYTTDAQSYPAVSEGVSVGKFVTVWQSYGQDTNLEGVFGQRLDSAGALLGAEFQVNTYTTSAQRNPAVAAEGDFLVVWVSSGQDGSSAGIFGQVHDGSGAPVGAEFQVNTHIPADQSSPDVARDSMGGFLVVWESDGQDGSARGIFVQRVDGAGMPLGAEFVVNTYTTGDQSGPAIDVDASGDFIVVWTSDLQDGDAKGVFGQRFSATGSPAGAEFQVNTYTTADQRNPAVATDHSGDFVVVWESVGQDGSNAGIFARRYNSAGTQQGNEFQVNTYTTGAQTAPAIAARPGGDFVVTWQSDGQDGSSGGVFARRFACAAGCSAGDGCCPAGCTHTTDLDCPNSAALCKQKKARELGKHTFGLARAFGKNLKTPNAAKLISDVSKARSKLTRRFTRAEFDGTGTSRGCDTVGDVGTLEGKVDIVVEDTLDEIDP